jgi:lysosomal Pro-X carboxypeptidase
MCICACTHCRPFPYVTNYFDTRTDNFNAHVTPRTFALKYLIYDAWYTDKSAPIFFYTGNEAPIELFADNTGIVWEWAQEFGALVVFAEHRYYGASLPFGNESFSGSNPQYLSVAQALADYTALITALQAQYHSDTSGRSPVIAFGGSYGGMLSAWWRLKYPQVVDGAIAGSAPILQFTNLTDPTVFASL